MPVNQKTIAFTIALTIYATTIHAENPLQKVKFFPLNEVRLMPGRFYDNMKRDSAWMMSIPVNSLLHSFRNNAGLFSGREGGYFVTKKLGGWESLDCDLRGHTTGHLLSAYGLMYASTGDLAFKIKADSIVDGLAEVQNALGQNGYLSAFPEQLIDRCIAGKSVWAPWYTLHKILAGLIDQYTYAGNGKALKIAEKIGDWAYNKVSALDSASIQRMIRNEYGGINEAFYDLYDITKDRKYFRLAELFYKADNIDPLKRKEDRLGTLHANTFIPKVIAEARRYEITGDKVCRTAAEYFHSLIDTKYSFSTGEIGDKEHFFNPQTTSKHLSGYDGETCCTYNELKLCRHLFEWNPNNTIMDYYERALYNQILGQQDPESGMVCYFTPLLNGTYKLYSTPNDSYWCCVGTGFENHAKYGESIYAHNSKDIYVNLFIASQLYWNEQGISLRQYSDFPNTNNSSLTIEHTPGKTWNLYIRKPQWATDFRIYVNGKLTDTNHEGNGYCKINRKWKVGDQVKVCLGMDIRKIYCYGDSSLTAIAYGPVILAGEEGKVEHPFSDPSLYNDYYTFHFNVPAGIDTSLSNDEIKSLHKIPARLEFMTNTGKLLKPLYDIHHARYVVYWETTH